MTQTGTRPRVLRAVLAAVLAFGVVTGVAPAGDLSTSDTPLTNASGSDAAAGTGPEIIELYPDPAADRDDGEFVTLAVPRGTNLSAYALADEQTRVPLAPANATTANETAAKTPDRARVTFSTNATRTAALTDRKVRPLSEKIRLANSGEKVRLLRNGTVVDEARYGQTTEAEVFDTAEREWDPLAATDFQPVSAAGGTVEAFALPDSPDRAVEFLDSADRSLLVAGYTLSSGQVVDTLVAAHERGVDVRVLVDGSPVGGLSVESATALDSLAQAGIEVRAFDGERARYRYHHAKYAVADDRALVTTENWKPAGVGGKSSRGWAVITDQRRVVDGLASVFRADADWVDTVEWESLNPETTKGEPATDDYPSEFEPESLPVERTTLLVTPDNARGEVLDLIENAGESIDIKQVRIGGRGFPFLEAVLAAAERGVEVRILLSGAWYVEEENRQLQTWLADQAAARDLPLSVRIAEPDGAYEKIHAKGMIVDGEHTLVGSMNWNNNSVQRNREIALLLESVEVASYFTGVFEADWKQDQSGRAFPAGLALAVLFAVVLAILGATRVAFER
jgi:cardiolipin synthase